MAHLAAKQDISVMKIDRFRGLNESPDGDTALKAGEFSVMRNFRVTQDGHLQKRPGSVQLLKLPELGRVDLDDDVVVVPGDDAVEPFAWGGGWQEETPSGGEGGGSGGGVQEEDPIDPPPTPVDPITGEDARLAGLWHGTVAGRDVTIVNYMGTLYLVNVEEGTYRELGTCSWTFCQFFAFGDKVYMINGYEYMAWDGGADGFTRVEGYIPTVMTAATPLSAGTQLEQLNRLTKKFKVEYSPDGTATEFSFPSEWGRVVSVIHEGVELLDSTGELAVTAQAPVTDPGLPSLPTHRITFSSPVPAGTNTVTVTFEQLEGTREELEGMRYAELFNGATDTRVFLYGDGSNRAFYSGVERSGKPSAEYFPALYEVAVGEANTPITAMVRHYSRLMVFKPSSAWSIQAGNLTMSDGILAPAYYVQPVNRQYGNEAPGQVKLLENNPLTLDGGCIYKWQSGSYYASYISDNQNNAKRFSDRVASTLRGFNLRYVRTCNIKRDHEFWFLYGNKALVYNYVADSWYCYDHLAYNDILEIEGEIYGFAHDGKVVHVSRKYRNDCGEIIPCYAETGSMDFGRDWQYKYSPMVFVAIKPEFQGRVYVTVETNRRSDYPEKLVSSNTATLAHVNFAHFSFVTNHKPQVKRLRLKVKKAAFYKLVYKISDKDATVTVIETDVRLRYGGLVK